MDKLEGLLFRFGIYRCQEGYDCILAAMELVEEDETLLKRLIGGLYPAAAARCGNVRCWNCLLSMMLPFSIRAVRTSSGLMPAEARNSRENRIPWLFPQGLS